MKLVDVTLFGQRHLNEGKILVTYPLKELRPPEVPKVGEWT